MAGNKLKLAVGRRQEDKSVAGNRWLVAGVRRGEHLDKDHFDILKKAQNG